MDFRDIEEYQKLNRLKSKYDCLVCEIVVPRKLEENIMSAIYGEGGDIEMAMLIRYLEDVADKLKETFPQVAKILPIIPEANLKEAYKHVENRGGN